MQYYLLWDKSEIQPKRLRERSTVPWWHCKLFKIFSFLKFIQTHLNILQSDLWSEMGQGKYSFIVKNSSQI